MARKPRRDLTIDEQLARGPLDLPFFMLVLLLTGVGFIMMFSASYASALYSVKADPFYYARRQILFVALGVVAMYIISKMNYRYFKPLAPMAIFVSEILLLLVFTPLGRSNYDARRWLNLGPLTFQPSEVAKVAVILYFAARLSRWETSSGMRSTI